jgi:molecular chaperone DnaK (HSP70)
MTSATRWEKVRRAMSRIVGIDLGTTNSLVAYLDAGVPKVIPDSEGRTLLPSVVAFTPNGIVVGEAARRQLARNPRRTIYSAKRLMGKGYEDVKDELRHLPFEVQPSAEVVRIKVGERMVTPPEVSAYVLEALKVRAEAFFGEKIEKAVITVPAYFNDAQRQATKDAGRSRDWTFCASSTSRPRPPSRTGLQRLAEGIVAVYDLGGGTFDVSILRVKDGIFEVLATNGNTHLRWRRLRSRARRWLLDDIEARHGVRLESDAEAMQELRLAAEAAKCRLSSRRTPGSRFPSSASRTGGTSRERILERLVTPLVDATLGSLPHGAQGCRPRHVRHRRGRPRRRLHAHAVGAASGGGALRAEGRTASSIPTRWLRSERRCKLRSWLVASRTCCYWT